MSRPHRLQIRRSDLRGVGRGQESCPTAATLDLDPQGGLAPRAPPCASRSLRRHADTQHADDRAGDARACAGSMDQRGLTFAATLLGHPFVRQRSLQVPALRGGTRNVRRSNTFCFWPTPNQEPVPDKNGFLEDRDMPTPPPDHCQHARLDSRDSAKSMHHEEWPSCRAIYFSNSTTLAPRL